MKVLHISYSVGRSSANTRLHYALLERGIDSKILTLEGDETLKEVYKIESKIYDELIKLIEVRVAVRCRRSC